MFNSSDLTIMAGNAHSVAADKEDTAGQYLADLLAEEHIDTAVEVEDQDYVEFYTTNPLGDLPGTIVVDAHADTWNGRTVRCIAALPDMASAQRTSSHDGGRYLCATATSWETIRGNGTPSPVEPLRTSHSVLAQEVATYVAAQLKAEADEEETEPETEPDEEETDVEPDEEETDVEPDEDTEPDETEPEDETEEETEEDDATAQAIRQAQEAADAVRHLEAMVKAAQEEEKAAQEARKVRMEQMEQLKRMHAQAKAAQAAAPIIIDAAMREKLDVLARLYSAGEQTIAKAIQSGVLFVRTNDKAKKDTGIIRATPKAQPMSNGVVDIERHGDGATVVNGTMQAEYAAKRDAVVEEIKDLIGDTPKELISDIRVARQLNIVERLGITQKAANTLVWHTKQHRS